MALEMTRGEVYLVHLDPTLASKIQKTRPCVIRRLIRSPAFVSPIDANREVAVPLSRWRNRSLRS